MSQERPFKPDARLTGIAIAVSNALMIADSVLPRVPVGTNPFKYLEYPVGQAFTLPGTLVGRRGKLNEVEFDAEEKESSAKDYGLASSIPQSDIDTAPEGHDPLGHATEMLTNLVILDREVRAASLVFNAATYGANNKTELVAGDKWSTSTGDSVTQLLDALDVPIMRPNVLVLGQTAWTSLRRNKFMVQAVGKSNAESGVVSREQVADILEIEEVLVGQGWVNSAKPGQPPTNVRVWDQHAALIHRNRLADTRAGVTFGLTAQHGSRVSGTQEDGSIGLRGGQHVRSGESVRELIVAPDVGYFFENVVN